MVYVSKVAPNVFSSSCCILTHIAAVRSMIGTLFCLMDTLHVISAGFS